MAMSLKLKLVFCFVAFAVLSAKISAQESSQTRAIQVYWRNKPMVRRQIKCVLDEGNCDSLGQTIKRILPEAVNHKCAKCSSQDRDSAKTIIGLMKKDYPAEWNKIFRKYSKH